MKAWLQDCDHQAPEDRGSQEMGNELVSQTAAPLTVPLRELPGGA